MKNLQKFDFLDAFLYPKRPNSKIPKNRKNCIFFKKSIFFKRSSEHHRRSEMVPNSPPKCSKHISNQYSMFTSIQTILDHFWKNRKKWIFEKKIFEHVSTKLAEYRPNIIRDWKNILRPLSEKNLTTTLWKFVILVGKKTFYRSEKIFFWHNFFVRDSEKVWSFDY